MHMNMYGGAKAGLVGVVPRRHPRGCAGRMFWGRLVISGGRISPHCLHPDKRQGFVCPACACPSASNNTDLGMQSVWRFLRLDYTALVGAIPQSYQGSCVWRGVACTVFLKPYEHAWGSSGGPRRKASAETPVCVWRGISYGMI